MAVTFKSFDIFAETLKVFVLNLKLKLFRGAGIIKPVKLWIRLFWKGEGSWPVWVKVSNNNRNLLDNSLNFGAKPIPLFPSGGGNKV